MGRISLPVRERIVDSIVVTDEGCWTWQKSTDPEGYGKISVNGRLVGAHRASYEAFVEPIAEGLHLDHLCRVRSCVNPDHLEPVTCRTNVLRGVGLAARQVARTHCPQGHPYAGSNLKIGADGLRRCRECRRQQDRASRARKRTAIQEAS